jgi:ATP-dependent RNA helicase RhlE
MAGIWRAFLRPETFFLTTSDFAALGLAEPLLRALAASGFHAPTPVQAASIPLLLGGGDLLGIAQTGTGKTAAFGLPLLQHLTARPGRAQPFHTRSLIIAPTRELAAQIEVALRSFAAGQRVSTALILGGIGRRPQTEAMRRGPDIVIGTPGRLCDLLATRELRLNQVAYLVLDEADRMLDLGFLPDIKRIAAALPTARQSMLFSATMPAGIEQLAQSFLRNPGRVEVEPEARTAEKIEQHVHHVPAAAKRNLLTKLLDDPALERVIVFTRTKHGANRVADHLITARIRTEALHGNKSQPQREKALDRFRSGRARVLVATDIASRGIDVQGVSHVINFDLPREPDSYVHRIGRTGRAGASGVAISFCDASEREALRAIERTAGAKLQAVGEAPAEVLRGSSPPRGRRRDRFRGGPNGRA